MCVWFVLMAAKMEGAVTTTWVTLSLPFFVALGLGACFAFLTLCIKKPAYTAFSMVTLCSPLLQPATCSTFFQHVKCDRYRVC